MLLAVDAGNSHTVLGLFAGPDLARHWRLASEPRQTGDELAVTLAGLLSLAGLAASDLDGMVVASVVPALEKGWRQVARTLLGQEALVVGDPDCRLGMPIRLARPGQVGPDRLVNALAAYHRCRQAVVVVDFGTATTFDCVAADGAFLGGAIVPGVGLGLAALAEKTARLPRVDLEEPPAAAIGTDPGAAIRSGVVFGYASLVDGLVARLAGEMAPPAPRVLATGGWAATIAPHAACIEAVYPHLTLEGLARIHATASRR
ncbi:MAG: type III pantothenate kinase [Thermodesulfobacteriota bacterium]